MKSQAASNCNRNGLALDFPQDEYSLMFPPSPEHSPSVSGSCSSWVVSPTLSAKSFSSTDALSPDATKPKKWVRKEKIGQGAQGSIYRCEETKTGREVAVKVIWTQELSPAAVEAVKREVKTMKKLRHRHLVRYLQATEKKQSELRIYMEYAVGGSLSSHLSRSGALSLALVKRYTRQLCEALQYLHQNGIAHRDIKCANILLTARNGSGDEIADIKLADFGTFKVVGCASLVGGLKGTPHWMAPEVIRQQNMGEDGNHERWFRADVWSLGCAVLEMITGHSPWEQFSNPLTAMYQIVSSEITPTIPADVPEETASFLQLCLQRDPEHRATIKQLLEHPFVLAAAESLSKLKARTSRHRIKRLGDAKFTSVVECNQQSSQSSPSTPNMKISTTGRDLAPEPEPHEDSSSQSHFESPSRQKAYNLKPLATLLPLGENNKRRPQPQVLHLTRERLLGLESCQTISPAKQLPRTPRLKALEAMTNQDTNMIPSPVSLAATTGSILMPKVPPTLSRRTSAGSRRLQRLLDLKAETQVENLSVSPIRLRRIATAPTAPKNLEPAEEIYPDTIRLPPLTARPPKTRCNSASNSN